MLVVFCLPGAHYSGRFLRNWTDLTQSLRERGIEFLLKQKYSSMVHFARMGCLDGEVIFGEKQQPFQGRIPYDRMMWIDSDIDFKPEDFFKLLEEDRPIISGLYKMQNAQTGNEEYAAKILNETQYLTDAFIAREGIENTVVPADFAGMGWMMIKRGVIESMDYPWFRSLTVREQREDMMYPTAELQSEDVFFCRRANALGHQCFLHTGCKVGHEKTIVLR